MRKTAKPKNTTERSISMAELLCLGIESTSGAERKKKVTREYISYDEMSAQLFIFFNLAIIAL